MNSRQKKQRTHLRRAKAKANSAAKKIWICIDQFEKFITSMSNWQNSQWLRAGNKRKDAKRFSKMKRSIHA